MLNIYLSTWRGQRGLHSIHTMQLAQNLFYHNIIIDLLLLQDSEEID